MSAYFTFSESAANTKDFFVYQANYNKLRYPFWITKKLPGPVTNFNELVSRFDMFDPMSLLLTFHNNNLKWTVERPLLISWPDNLIKTKIGVCFDHSLFFYKFCKYFGVEAAICYIDILAPGYDGSFFSHAYPMFMDNDKETWIWHFAGGAKGQKIFSDIFGPFKSFKDAVKKASGFYRLMATSQIRKHFRIVPTNADVFNFLLEENSIDEMFNLYENNKLTQTELLDKIPAAQEFYDQISGITHTSVMKGLRKSDHDPLWKLDLKRKDREIIIPTSKDAEAFMNAIKHSNFKFLLNQEA